MFYFISDTPKFLIRPHDQTVAVGRTISLQCAAAGNPEPTIYWETASQKVSSVVVFDIVAYCQ